MTNNSSFIRDDSPVLGGRISGSTIEIKGVWPQIMVYVDGHEMENLLSVSVDLRGGETPIATLTLAANEIDIDQEFLVHLQALKETP